MATAYHNLSDYDFNSVPDASAMRFGIVVSEWNYNITGALLAGAVKTLQTHGAKEENILVQHVPGSFELTFGSAQMIQSGKVDAVIAIGCVVRGDTPHFDYVCAGTTQGIAHLNATTDIPVIYGLITTNNMQQAEDRAGGCLGNKGDECAVTAIKMIDFKRQLKQYPPLFEGKSKENSIFLKKIPQNTCGFKKKPYLCIAIEKQSCKAK